LAHGLEKISAKTTFSILFLSQTYLLNLLFGAEAVGQWTLPEAHPEFRRKKKDLTRKAPIESENKTKDPKKKIARTVRGRSFR
jgi:hypothetical protein